MIKEIELTLFTGKGEEELKAVGLVHEGEHHCTHDVRIDSEHITMVLSHLTKDGTMRELMEDCVKHGINLAYKGILMCTIERGSYVYVTVERAVWDKFRSAQLLTIENDKGNED